VVPATNLSLLPDSVFPFSGTRNPFHTTVRAGLAWPLAGGGPGLPPTPWGASEPHRALQHLTTARNSFIQSNIDGL
jgi:hypothetical protein